MADKFVRQAEACPKAAWEALLADPANADLDDRLRNAALDFAESWFKRALALKVGKGIRLHISRNADYRRV